MDGRLIENEKLFREFNRLLTAGGIFSFAVYNEIQAIQDSIYGPLRQREDLNGLLFLMKKPLMNIINLFLSLILAVLS